MEQFEIQVDGAPVIYSDRKPPPYNPLHRPEIHYRKPIIALVLFLVILGALITVGVMYAKPWTVWMCLGWGIVFFAVIAKRALIWCVHLYQNKASDATRLKCVFEPSCSEYMILASEPSLFHTAVSFLLFVLFTYISAYEPHSFSMYSGRRTCL